MVARWGSLAGNENMFEYYSLRPHSHGKEFQEIFKRHFIFYEEGLLGTRKSNEFRFHAYQFNHRFLLYMRGVIFAMNMPLDQINNKIIDAVLYRGKFNNHYWELLSYFMY